jgi:anaerobic ribonucleoside-triphosphate reductase activating protein
MNYATIKKVDVANGPGIRVSLFVSGCMHHCKGCFNPETWNYCYGSPFTKETEDEILEALKPDYIKGLSLLGGEPLDPANQLSVLSLVLRFKEMYPTKTLWCYTGYTFESDILTGKLGNQDALMLLLQNIDVLVDGEFVLELKNPNLRFRGSSNQRLIDVKASLETGSTVVLDEDLKKC